MATELNCFFGLVIFSYTDLNGNITKKFHKSFVGPEMMEFSDDFVTIS